VNVPIIICLNGRKCETLVLLHDEAQSGKARELSEVNRAKNAVCVHVADPRVHVIGPGTKLLERRWLIAIFFLGATDDGIEAKTGDFFLFDLPGLTILSDHYFGFATFVFGRNMLLEHVRGLANMIIHTDQYHVIQFHNLLQFVTALPQLLFMTTIHI